jgi:hypothetical protein
MVYSKSAMECLLTLLKTIKETFKTAARCSVFLVNKHMQAFILEGQEKYARSYKQMQLTDKKTIYAIFQTEKDQCKPCFTTVRQARKTFF